MTHSETDYDRVQYFRGELLKVEAQLAEVQVELAEAKRFAELKIESANYWKVRAETYRNLWFKSSSATLGMSD